MLSVSYKLYILKIYKIGSFIIHNLELGRLNSKYIVQITQLAKRQVFI